MPCWVEIKVVGGCVVLLAVLCRILMSLAAASYRLKTVYIMWLDVVVLWKLCIVSVVAAPRRWRLCRIIGSSVSCRRRV